VHEARLPRVAHVGMYSVGGRCVAVVLMHQAAAPEVLLLLLLWVLDVLVRVRSMRAGGRAVVRGGHGVVHMRSAAERRVRDSRGGWWRWWPVHLPVTVVIALSVPRRRSRRIRATADAHAAAGGAARSRQQCRRLLASVHSGHGRLSRRGAMSLGLGMPSACHGSRCRVRLLADGTPHGIVVLRARGGSGGRA
jgi:hypothetical protein